MKGVFLLNLLRTLVMVMMIFAVNSVTFASGAFRMGDQGSEVAEIQGYLIKLGYDVMADGDYGPSTVDAVKSFQKTQGLNVNGTVDEKTYRILVGREMPEVSRGITSMARRLTSIAMQYIGTPYVFGGNSLYYGIDCSAYTQQIYAQIGINLPRTADVQYEVGTPISRSELLPGDEVFFTTYTYGASHCGIYLGDGNFIHASSSRGVTISSLNDHYYSTHYIGARRMF
jgi:cell wall-associated NlpC family hydrolase